MKYNTNILLSGLHAETEQILDKLIGSWQLLPGKQFLQSSGGWNAAQCLDHLNSYGRYYVPEMSKAIEKAAHTQSETTFKSSFLGNYFYKTMLTDANGNAKTKMKSPKDHLPATQLSTPAVISEFITQLELLQEIIRKSQNIDISKARVPISIAKFIRLPLGDILLFYVAHISRHVKQAERALQLPQKNQAKNETHRPQTQVI